MSETSIILAAIQGAENRLREDVHGLRKDINDLNIKTAEHGVEISTIKTQMRGLWRRSPKRDSSPLAIGGPNMWYAIVEFLGAVPKLWHVIFVFATLIVTLTALFHKLIH